MSGGSRCLVCLLRKTMYTNIRCSVRVKSSIQFLEIVQKSGNAAFEIITWSPQKAYDLSLLSYEKP